MVYGKKMKLDVLYNRDLCSIITSYIPVVRIKGMDEAVLTRAMELLKETYGKTSSDESHSFMVTI